MLGNFGTSGKGFRIIVGAIILFTAQWTYACSGSSEKGLVDSILNLDDTGVETDLAQLTESDLLIPSKDFYLALNVWYQGYQQKTAVKSRGIRLLRQAVKSLASKIDNPQQSDLNTSKGNLALGLARGQLARVLLEDERYLAGYNMGMAARKNLKSFLASADSSTPGFYDARFLEGLYEVYTHDLLNRNHWLIGRIDYRGDRTRGIQFIESAIAHNAVFSSDAMRTLLGEVSWRTPDFCAYTDAIEHFSTELPRNSDLAVLRQGLLLKCGLPQRAAAANRFYQASAANLPVLQQQNARAKLRILADLGDLNSLSNLTPPEDDKALHQLAMANALDVSGQREKALQHYKQLTESSDPAVASVAEVRLQHRYKPPKKQRPAQFQLAACTG